MIPHFLADYWLAKKQQRIIFTSQCQSIKHDMLINKLNNAGKLMYHRTMEQVDVFNPKSCKKECNTLNEQKHGPKFYVVYQKAVC